MLLGLAAGALVVVGWDGAANQLPEWSSLVRLPTQGSLPAGLLGVVLGVRSLGRADPHASRRGRDMAMTGVSLSCVVVVVWWMALLVAIADAVGYP